MRWTVFVKKPKWSLGTLPISLSKGTTVTQKIGTTTAKGTLAKTTSQRSTTFQINVENNVQFDRFHDIHVGTFKIATTQLIQTISAWYPRLMSQSHQTYTEIYPPPPPRETTIDIKDTTVASYTALDLADCKSNRRSKNLRTILKVELDNRNQSDHKTSVTGAHVDSLHHQKKLAAVKNFFGPDRKLFYISVDELERVIDDAGIGHLEYTQTMGIEGIPMNKKRRKQHPALKSKKQMAAIQNLLAEIFQVMTLHVHVLDVREGMETVENPPPKKLSLCQRVLRMNKKKVKLRRSEVDYMISTHSGPPSIKLETQQRLLVKVGQLAKDKDSGSSSDEDSSDSSDDEGGGGGGRKRLGSDFTNDTEDDSDDSDGSDSSDSSDDEDDDGVKKGGTDLQPHVEVQYTDGGTFANVLVDPLGDLIGLLDQDVENPALIVAHEPVRQVIIPTAGFMSRKAALLDAFGSYLTKKKDMETSERRIAKKKSLGMKMGPPSPTKRKRKKKSRHGGGSGTKYAVNTARTLNLGEDVEGDSIVVEERVVVEGPEIDD